MARRQALVIEAYQERFRFETLTWTHGIYWTRHAFDQSVMIISCFKRGDE